MARKGEKIENVKRHLLNKGSITSWEAIGEYRVTRLSSIIFDLRKQGFDIVSIPIEFDGGRYTKYVYQKLTSKNFQNAK